MNSQDLMYQTNMQNNGFLNQAQLDEWARFYAQEKSDNADDLTAAQWLVFRAGGEVMTFSAHQLDEISPVTSGVVLPQQNEAVMGVVNLRGETAILIDLACMIGLETVREVHEDQRMLFFKDEKNRKTGCLVSRIEGIYDLKNITFQDAREHKEIKNRFVDGIGERDGHVISSLNINALLNGVEELLKQ